MLPFYTKNHILNREYPVTTTLNPFISFYSKNLQNQYQQFQQYCICFSELHDFIQKIEGYAMVRLYVVILTLDLKVVCDCETGSKDERYGGLVSFWYIHR